MMPIRVRLPFFPDLGPGVSNTTIYGKPATDMAAKDLYPRWYEFRTNRLASALATLRSALQERSPRTEILIHQPGTWGNLMPWELPGAKLDGAATPKPMAKPVPNALPAFLWISSTYKKVVPPGTAPMNAGDRFARQTAPMLAWVGEKITPETKAMLATTKLGLFLDLSEASLEDAEGLLARIVIEP